MRALIAGAGIAGLNLAYWLSRAGNQVTLVERAPELRAEGYMIDFFGSGYDVAEQMGLLPDLQQIHYPVAKLSSVDACGKERFSTSYASLRRLMHERHFNFMRGDLERVLYRRVSDAVELRFGTTIAELHEPTTDGRPVAVQLDDGSSGQYDLVIGADGIHSALRAKLFGEQRQYIRPLGYLTVAFVMSERPAAKVADDALCTLSEPGRQVAVYPIRGGRLATFFIFPTPQPTAATPPSSPQDVAAMLQHVYAGLGWVVPELLERCAEPDADLYFDAVAQIELPRWSAGRSVLVGDACQCVSLLAGQGASMAMAGGYVLARELAAAGGDVRGALQRYEQRLKPSIVRQQRAGRRMAGWFVPKNRMRQRLADLSTRMVEWPLLWRLIRRSLAGDSIITG